MAAKFFGQFLLEKGLITSAHLLQALELQRTSNPLLGELAVALGMLDAADAGRINDRQRREDKRFGDLALDMGLLDASQLERLLAEQAARRRLFGEILLELGALDAAVLERELALHRNERDDAAHALELGLAGHPRARLVGSAIDTACKLFLRVLKTPCQFSAMLDTADAGRRFDAGVEVAISGDAGFRIALLCQRAAMFSIADGFFAGRVTEIDPELAQDAFGEFLNIVMGYVVQDNLPHDARYRPSPPRALGGAAALSLSGEPVAVELTTPIGEVALVLAGP